MELIRQITQLDKSVAGSNYKIAMSLTIIRFFLKFIFFVLALKGFIRINIF